MTHYTIATSLVQDTLSAIDTFRASQPSPNIAIIYGSYATGTSTRFSDIDIMFLCKQTPSIEPFVKFVTELHSFFSHEIDQEVPFSNKLVISYDEANTATKLEQFSLSGDEITIPPIKKSQEFLNSQNIKLRLVFNALTSPNIFIGGDAKTYRSVQRKAWQALAILSTALCGKEVFSTKDLLATILRGKNDEEGELYLGYKNNPQTTNALWSNLTQGLSDLCKKKLLERQGANYKRSPAFLQNAFQLLALNKQ